MPSPAAPGAPRAGQTPDGWRLIVVDYCPPFNEQYRDQRDIDLGSSAPLLLPDSVGSAAHPHLLLVSGKEGVIYLIDRDNLGKFGLSNNVVQNIPNQTSGHFGTASIFNGRVYLADSFGGVAKTFTIANGVMSISPTSTSSDSFAFPGSTASISANNLSNGIVWNVDRGTNQLRAYSTDTYASELYTSAQAGLNRDTLGAAVKFE